jgi:hypothetical protein
MLGWCESAKVLVTTDEDEHHFVSHVVSCDFPSSAHHNSEELTTDGCFVNPQSREVRGGHESLGAADAGLNEVGWWRCIRVTLAECSTVKGGVAAGTAVGAYIGTCAVAAATIRTSAVAAAVAAAAVAVDETIVAAAVAAASAV